MPKFGNLLSGMKGDTSVVDIMETLKASPFLAGVNERHLRAMAECAMPTSFEEGELIFREGDVANRFYLIQNGSVALESKRSAGDAIRIQTIGVGDVLGWSWLFPPYLWHFDARAIEASKVLFIYGSRLRDHCEDDHDFGYEVIKRIAEVIMARLQATRWQLFQISDLALQSQWEALNLASQLNAGSFPAIKHFRAGRTSTHYKPQLTQKK